MNREYRIFGLIIACIFGLTSNARAQVRANQNIANNGAPSSTAFLDASSSTIWNSSKNLGKGLIFPRVDLTDFPSVVATGATGLPTNFPSRMDGMLVYNTGNGPASMGGNLVTPGFYFYSNKTANLQGGTWTSLTGSTVGGRTIASTISNVDNTVTFNYTDGTSFTTVDLKGATGAAGKSAFEIWLETHPGGTITQFETSIKGDKGDAGADGKSAFDIWLEIHPGGTITQFEASLKGDVGDQGLAGQSAFDVWKEIQGNELKTVTDYLADIKGAPGAVGKDGSQIYSGTNSDPEKGAPSDVKDGDYYFDKSTSTLWGPRDLNTGWIGTGVVLGGGIGNGWSLTGNAGTNPGLGAGQNYIGTPDDKPVLFATNGVEAFRATNFIDDSGTVFPGYLDLNNNLLMHGKTMISNGGNPTAISVFINNQGPTNLTGTFNIGMGVQAGTSITTGSANVMVGKGAGEYTTIGSGNAFVGNNAGSQNIVGFGNAALGTGSGPSVPNLNNTTTIGAFAHADRSNTVIIGAEQTQNISQYDIGFNITNPRAAFDINSKGAMIIPTGDNSITDKPAGRMGMLRFNSQLNVLEYADNTNTWQNIPQGGSVILKVTSPSVAGQLKTLLAGESTPYTVSVPNATTSGIATVNPTIDLTKGIVIGFVRVSADAVGTTPGTVTIMVTNATTNPLVISPQSFRWRVSVIQ